ncbi:sulfatase-like hydrolase/transferase [Haloferula chungangensis]|uniref:Sulfatase-like hydrolase/transferase n=1 Tax=Haloferula chungangensis TaxID=1048331 RepID=A0ABW2L9E1_9BACT
MIPYAITLALLASPVLCAQAIRSSWLTSPSGQYARVYTTASQESSGTSVTSWKHASGTSQEVPTYAGVSEIAVTADDLYIRTSGLAFHVMGPWQGENGRPFPNYPVNIAQTARFPLSPTMEESTKTPTGLGAIGYFVDGVAMFDSRDAFSYIASEKRDARPRDRRNRGDGIWNRDAYVNESPTFDSSNAHQAGGTHHYHANPPGLRHLLGDSVDYDATSNTYRENPNGDHSPILGWAFDGIPLYGPYGYSDPMDPDSPVRRMISGYQKRDGSNGSTNLAATGRKSLPAWIIRNEPERARPLRESQYGPDLDPALYPLGQYLEDYDYLGDLGKVQGKDFDLNEYNVRFCVTPDFPEGTWAYFCCIDPHGTPVFPYNIGRYFFGKVTGGNVRSVPENRTVLFKGGPNITSEITVSKTDDESITLTWTGAEGGEYQIESSRNLDSWKVVEDATKLADGKQAELVLKKPADTHFRSVRTSLDAFDDRGFSPSSSAAPTFTALFDELPPLDEVASIGVGGLKAEITSISGDTISLSFDKSQLPPGEYPATIRHSEPGSSPREIHSTNALVIAPPRNILLLILDDWGIDSSPIDNTPQLSPGASFPAMPNLEALAERGIQFTNAYAQPVCSPTRASILTGRHPFRHGVGNPMRATLSAEELSLPEVFAKANSPYQLASFGKWHLGGGDKGPAELGGWPEFSGFLRGGVSNYYKWSKTKNGSSLGTIATYTTTDQVNDTIDFITRQQDKPWFAWVGFNAPHSPFHNPPQELQRHEEYPTDDDGQVVRAHRRDAYEASLEALDHEIGRLLKAVDLEKTNVILIGDNGTPAQVIQAPFERAHAKDTLYQGGIHVPLVIAGPDVPEAGTSDAPVHCVDLFSTILELAQINVTEANRPGEKIDSQSLVPILQGRDTGARTVVSERFSSPSSQRDGRAIISSLHPDYKLIVFGDPRTSSEHSKYEMYRISSDPNEKEPLGLPPAEGDDHFAAYEALIAIDASLKNPDSAPAKGDLSTYFIELSGTRGPRAAPRNMRMGPERITINGQVATFISRSKPNGEDDQNWIKCTAPAMPAPLKAVVTFPDNPRMPTGEPRVIDSLRTLREE